MSEAVLAHQLGKGGCVPCRSNPCCWKPCLNTEAYHWRRDLVNEEMERVKKFTEAYAMESTVCLSASADGAALLIRRDLLEVMSHSFHTPTLFIAHTTLQITLLHTTLSHLPTPLSHPSHTNTPLTPFSHLPTPLSHPSHTNTPLTPFSHLPTPLSHPSHILLILLSPPGIANRIHPLDQKTRTQRRGQGVPRYPHRQERVCPGSALLR